MKRNTFGNKSLSKEKQLNKSNSSLKFPCKKTEQKKERSICKRDIELIKEFLDKCSVDPILEVLKSSKMTKPFFLQRIDEMMKKHLDDDREALIISLEDKIENLNLKVQKLQGKNQELSNSLEIKLNVENQLKSEIDDFKFRFSSEINEKSSKLTALQKNYYEIEKKLAELKAVNLKLSKESEENKIILPQFESQTEKLEEENKSLQIALKKSSQNVEKLNSQVELLKVKIDEFKQNYTELSFQYDTLQTNTYAKTREIEEKGQEIQDLIRRIDSLKSEFLAGQHDYEIAIATLKEKCTEKEKIIQQKLKPKNKALKTKLKEKVLNLEQIEKDFTNYQEEHESAMSRVMQTNQKIIEDKNHLIQQLLSKAK